MNVLLIIGKEGKRRWSRRSIAKLRVLMSRPIWRDLPFDIYIYICTEANVCFPSYQIGETIDLHIYVGSILLICVPPRRHAKHFAGTSSLQTIHL